MSKKPRKYDAWKDMHFIGGHWYPSERLPMTAREYRAWKRWFGVHYRRRLNRWARRRPHIITIWDEVSKWQM